MQKKINKTYVIVFGLIVIAVLYLLAPILTPFLAAALLAYLIDPMVEKMVSWKIPRLLSVSIVFLIFILGIAIAILLLIPVIQKQIEALSVALPKAMDWFQDVLLPWVEDTFSMQTNVAAGTIKKTITQNLTSAGGAATWVLKKTLESGLTLVEWVTNLVLIPVLIFYLLRDWKKILKNIRELLPRNIEPTIVKLASQCDAVLSEFFRGQLLVMLALGIIYSIGLTAIGLPIGLLIGLVSGLVSIVPYLGFIVGIIAASIAAYVQFGTFNAILLVWLVFAIGQTIESAYLTPKLVGPRIGLHPIAVIFAILAGGSLFGFFGVLLALPVAAVIMVLLRYFNHHYQNSRLYQ